jgi:ribosomal protein RSM22 (predicted rRNA methylase)
MELPRPLRRAIEELLDRAPRTELVEAATALSRRYRGELPAPYVTDDSAVLAYLAARLPATYAASRASLAAIAQLRPDFSPATMLDVGAGPGTALWAATDCWPGLNDALLIEANTIFRACGERLSAEMRDLHTAWRTVDATTETIDSAPRDLVTVAYVLGELVPEARRRLVQQVWQLTADVFVIIEPGTPAGWQRVMDARDVLITNGAHLIAPCPHARACPLQPPDWCHFAQRVARSRWHRAAKDAALAWEDEKFSYLAVSRRRAATPMSRVIARPRKGSGRVTLKLCQHDGSAGQALFSRRDGARYKRAVRSAWGDALDD